MMRRRTFLAATTASSLSAVSGCTSSLLQTRTATVGWSYPTEKIVEYEIGDEYVYVLGQSKLHAISRTDGTQEWTHRVEKSSGFDLDETTVYVYGEERLAAIERSTGRKRWDALGSYQLVFRGTGVIVGYKWNGVDTLAFDPVTGDRKWKWSGSRLSRLSDSIALTYDDRLAGVDLRNGTQLWRFEDGPASYESTADTVYATVETKEDSFVLFALDPVRGSVRWRQSSITGHLGDVNLLDGVLYITWHAEHSEDDCIAALDPDSGSIQWRTKNGEEQKSPYPFAVKDDTLLVSQTTYDGPLRNLNALDSHTGSQEWQRADAEVVTMAEDRIVLEESRGRFRGIDIDGAQQWTTTMEFVPMAASAGSNPVYTPPRVVPLAETFAAGFSGTNVVGEWAAVTGDRTWQLHLNETFRSLDGTDGQLFASTGRKLIQIQIDNGGDGGMYLS